MSKKRKKSRDRQTTEQQPAQSESANTYAKESAKESTVAKLCAIDLRSLAAFRIAIALVLLADLGIRATDLVAMYTDQGAFPRELICQYYTSIWNWSFHFGSGEPWYQGLLFALSGIFAVGLLVGYESRWCTVGSWLLLISMHNRVPVILNGADNLIRMLLFWAMFLPVGERWSVDAVRTKGKLASLRATHVWSVASAAILLQMACMYFFSAIFKSNQDWWQGNVISAALSHGFYARPLGVWLSEFTSVFGWMTVGILVFEWIGPVLLFSPIRTVQTRLATVALLGLMHLGIELTLTVGFFSWVSLAGLLLFLPTQFWEWLAVRSQTGQADIQTKPKMRFTAGAVNAPVVRNALAAIAGLALAYVLWINVNSVASQPGSGEKENEFLNLACGLGQKWDMFAEAPSRDGWYVALATTNDGNQIDLLRDGDAVSWERPTDPASLYKNHRWSKCYREMSYADALGYQVFREPITEYLGRAWNKSSESQRNVTHVSLLFCYETETSDGRNVVRETLGYYEPTVTQP